MAKKKWSSRSTNRVKNWTVIVDGDMDCVSIMTERKFTNGTASGVGFDVSPAEAEALIAGLERYLDERALQEMEGPQ